MNRLQLFVVCSPCRAQLLDVMVSVIIFIIIIVNIKSNSNVAFGPQTPTTFSSVGGMRDLSVQQPLLPTTPVQTPTTYGQQPQTSYSSV